MEVNNKWVTAVVLLVSTDKKTCGLLADGNIVLKEVDVQLLKANDNVYMWGLDLANGEAPLKYKELRFAQLSRGLALLELMQFYPQVQEFLSRMPLFLQEGSTLWYRSDIAKPFSKRIIHSVVKMIDRSLTNLVLKSDVCDEKDSPITFSPIWSNLTSDRTDCVKALPSISDLFQDPKIDDTLFIKALAITMNHTQNIFIL